MNGVIEREWPPCLILRNILLRTINFVEYLMSSWIDHIESEYQQWLDWWIDQVHSHIHENKLSD